GPERLPARLHPGPSSRPRAHVANRAVHEESGRAEGALDTRVRLAHEVSGEKEIVATESGAGHGVVPDDRQRAAVQPHDLQATQPLIERFLDAALGDVPDLGTARSDAGPHLCGFCAPGGFLEALEESPPDRRRELIDREKAEEPRVRISARARM